MLLHTSRGRFKVSTHACGSGLQVVVQELRMQPRYVIAAPRICICVVLADAFIAGSE
jgi:hypothetical protein